MRNKMTLLALVFVTGCASTNFTVLDSAGKPIPGAIAFRSENPTYQSEGKTIAVLTDDAGRTRMRGMPLHVAIGKKGYFPAVVSRYGFLFMRNIPVTLFSTSETERCRAGTAWDTYIYKAPYDAKESDVAAFAQWKEYLEWLREQPPYRSLLP